MITFCHYGCWFIPVSVSFAIYKFVYFLFLFPPIILIPSSVLNLISKT